MEAPVPYLGHPLFKPVQVINTLSLDKFDTGFDLLAKPDNPVKKWIGKRVGGCAHKKVRWVGKGLTSDDLGLVTHPSYRLDQLDRIQIKDPQGLGLIAEGLMVAAQTEDIPDPQGRGPQDVGLKGYPISIPNHHLEHRIKPFLTEQGTSRQAG